MKNKIYSLFLLTLLTLTIISCSDDDDLEKLSVESLTDKQKLMQETSKLVGKLLTDNDVKSALTQKMQEADKDANIVSFAYLFEHEAGFRKNELENFSKKASDTKDENIFKIALKKEFEENRSSYEVINKTLDNRKSTNSLAKTGVSIANELTSLLVSEELQIFYPYDPDYEDDTNIQEFHVSYDPLTDAQTNMGYKFQMGSTASNEVYGLDNDFLDNNPVYLIVPIDPCDMPGRDCDFIDLQPALQNSNSGVMVPTTSLLTSNINHNDIPESDIISSQIPRIQINGTSWMGFGGTHQKLRFYRGTTDGFKITQNTDGTITASGTKYIITDFRCKRKYLKRKKRWLDINAEFDPDWNMSENTQVMAVFSIHHISSSASAELTAKSGFKLEDGEIKPHSEASGSVKIKFSLGSSKFRSNTEMSRRQILATIVGPGTTSKTISDNGVEYNVKRIGIIDYYFKHYYTDL